MEGVPIRHDIITREGAGFSSMFEIFGFIFIVLAMLLCRAVPYIRLQTYTISKEENKYVSSGIYVRTTCERA